MSIKFKKNKSLKNKKEFRQLLANMGMGEADVLKAFLIFDKSHDGIVV